MKEKTVLILGEDKQITLEGEISILDTVGVTADQEITEVVDDNIVYCYTIGGEVIWD